jgi:hypothetical protein
MLPTNPTLPHKPKQNNCIKLFYNQSDQMKKKKKKKKKKKRKEEERKKERRKEKGWFGPAP